MFSVSQKNPNDFLSGIFTDAKSVQEIKTPQLKCASENYLCGFSDENARCI